MHRLLRLSFVLSALGLVGTAVAQTNILLNGDFASGTPTYIGAGASVPNWSFYDDPNPDALHFPVYESGHLRFNEGGGGTEGVMQSFTASVGLTYTASLDALVNGSPLSLRFEIQTDDVSHSVVSFLATPVFSAGYNTFTFDFVAPQTALRFVIRDDTAAGAENSTDLLIDNASVTLTPIPEPSTYGMFAGLGALGWVAWRRRLAAPKSSGA